MKAGHSTYSRRLLFLEQYMASCIIVVVYNTEILQ